MELILELKGFCIGRISNEKYVTNPALVILMMNLLLKLFQTFVRLNLWRQFVQMFYDCFGRLAVERDIKL